VRLDRIQAQASAQCRLERRVVRSPPESAGGSGIRSHCDASYKYSPIRGNRIISGRRIQPMSITLHGKKICQAGQRCCLLAIVFPGRRFADGRGHRRQDGSRGSRGQRATRVLGGDRRPPPEQKFEESSSKVGCGHSDRSLQGSMTEKHITPAGIWREKSECRRR